MIIGLLLKVVKEASIELPAFSDPFPYSDPYTKHLESVESAIGDAKAANIP